MSQVLVGNREFHDAQAICQHITIGGERQIPLLLVWHRFSFVLGQRNEGKGILGMQV